MDVRKLLRMRQTNIRKEMTERKTDNHTLANAMHILANEIQSPDGVANAATREAGDRILELVKENESLKSWTNELELSVCEMSAQIIDLEHENQRQHDKQLIKLRNESRANRSQ